MPAQLLNHIPLNEMPENVLLQILDQLLTQAFQTNEPDIIISTVARLKLTCKRFNEFLTSENAPFAQYYAQYQDVAHQYLDDALEHVYRTMYEIMHNQAIVYELGSALGVIDTRLQNIYGDKHSPEFYRAKTELLNRPIIQGYTLLEHADIECADSFNYRFDYPKGEQMAKILRAYGAPETPRTAFFPGFWNNFSNYEGFRSFTATANDIGKGMHFLIDPKGYNERGHRTYR